MAQGKSEWVLAGAGDDMLSFMDSKSVKGEQGYLAGWIIRYNQHTQDKVKGQVVGYYISRYAWNCHTRQLALITTALYDRKKALLQSDNSVQPYMYDWEYAIPGTLGEMELELACSYAPNESYFADLAEVVRKRNELGQGVSNHTDSIDAVIAAANRVMPWAGTQSGAKPSGAKPKATSSKKAPLKPKR